MLDPALASGFWATRWVQDTDPGPKSRHHRPGLRGLGVGVTLSPRLGLRVTLSYLIALSAGHFRHSTLGRGQAVSSWGAGRGWRFTIAEMDLST